MICVSVRVRTSLFAANISRANAQRLVSDCGKRRKRRKRGEREEEGEKGDERRKKDTVYVSTEYMMMLLMNALQHTHNRVNMMPHPCTAPLLLRSPAYSPYNMRFTAVLV